MPAVLLVQEHLSECSEAGSPDLLGHVHRPESELGRPPLEPATSSPSVNVLPKIGSVKRIASSLTTLCCGGVTSVHFAFGGETESSNDTFEICVPAMYIA